MTSERSELIADLTTTLVGSERQEQTIVILLHGYAMRATDLASFVHALGGTTLFLLPQAPHPTPMGGYGWWEVNVEMRAAALQHGPRDLANEQPHGLALARQHLRQFIHEVIRRFAPRNVVLGGFSQGGMLACDFVLHDEPAIAGLFLLSSSRININAWRARQSKLQALPLLISHGRTDDDLSFEAGHALRDFATTAGARVRWVEFEQGHQIPLPVWRELRRFIRDLEQQ